MAKKKHELAKKEKGENRERKNEEKKSNLGIEVGDRSWQSNPGGSKSSSLAPTLLFCLVGLRLVYICMVVLSLMRCGSIPLNYMF